MAAVVIVGAGPAGAALAYLLARREIDVTLIERHTDFAREFRGEALMPSGIDAFAQMGLGGGLDRLPQTRPQVAEIYRGPRRLFRLDLAEVTGGGPMPRFVSQPAVLEMLVSEAGRFPRFRLERGTTVRDLVRVDGRVSGVRAERATGGVELRADLVVGADGRASSVRARAGLHEERAPQIFDVVWCKVPLLPSLAAPVTIRGYIGRGHGAIVFPAPDGRLQVGWIIAKGAFGDLRRRGIAAWLEAMAEHVSPDLAAHLRASRDQITHPFLLDVVCDHLVRWTVPGLLLLGDAAHPMSPVGGQGINIALRDALVAANHLVPVLARAGTAAEIDAAAVRIQDERLPEVIEVQRLQQAPPGFLFGDRRASRLVIDVVLPILVRTRLPQLLLRGLVRRFAFGVRPVRLEV